jgi:hypothetical protein
VISARAETVREKPFPPDASPCATWSCPSPIDKQRAALGDLFAGPYPA